ncbi:ISNCY family transposase [Lachnospiraceae bacterium OttesenSCG-928-D06]|nr:ISNCY family transposase [Lachnospiraceae bacterium OttesenSCG-928-D06]
MEANEKYETIKRLAEGHITKLTASVKIGCTMRHVNRLLKKYQTEGKAGFQHGNSGRKPAHALTEQMKNDIITLYNNNYWDTNFTHCCELMERLNGIKISPTTLRKILYSEFILSPRATKRTRKQMKKILTDLHKETKSNSQKKLIEAAIVTIEDSHSRRPRCAYFGEMLQMDASLHCWFGDCKSQLHIAIDDSTGTVVGAYFDYQETLNGYYNVLHQVLTQYGIPNMLYTDNRTVFEYKNKKMKDIGKDTFTQFSYACKQLGIEIKTTSIPQAKGRVERLFGTLQSRLPVELRLKGINTIDEANVFLNSYIKEYNARFALPIDHNKSVFIVQPTSAVIDQTLAVLTPRVVDNGHCIKFQNKYYKTMDGRGLQVHYHRGVKGLVIKTFSERLLFSTNNQVYELEEIPLREQSSRNFDFKETTEKPRKRNIPSPQHPWKNEVFLKHVPYDYFPEGTPA